MQTLGEKILELMGRRGWTQERLAEAAGVSQVLVHKITAGKTKETRKIANFAKALGVSVELLTDEDLPLPPEAQGGSMPALLRRATKAEKSVIDDVSGELKIGRTREIPIVGTAEGGPNMEWVEMGYPTGYGDECVESPSNDPNAYALLVSGNSMAPRMRPGEAILVEPNHEPQPGDEVVIKLADGQTMVKIFSARRGNKITLNSISDDHDSIILKGGEIEFMHYVAAVFRAGSIKECNQ